MLFLLIPLFIAVVRRALDPAANAGAGSLFYVILPSGGDRRRGHRSRGAAAASAGAAVGVALAVCVLAGNVLLFTWMDDGEGLPIDDFARLVLGRSR